MFLQLSWYFIALLMCSHDSCTLFISVIEGNKHVRGKACYIYTLQSTAARIRVADHDILGTSVHHWAWVRACARQPRCASVCAAANPPNLMKHPGAITHLKPVTHLCSFPSKSWFGAFPYWDRYFVLHCWLWLHRARSPDGFDFQMEDLLQIHIILLAFCKY